MLTSEQRASLIRFTQELVRLPSEAGQEKAVADYLLGLFGELGYDTTRMDRFGNVIAEIHGAAPGPTLLLDAHTDTVGVPPGADWSKDPYGGEISGDRLYGRGSSDMKGSLAAMIVALSALDRSKLSGRVVLSASVLEEVLEGAALEHVMHATRPDFVIIGEASDLQIIRGGRGRAEILLEVQGRPSHSSAPEQGINAVEGMLNAVRALGDIDLPEHPFVGRAILVLTDIISEPYPGHSVIPTRCRATFDRRLLPGENRDAVLEPLARLPTIQGAKLQASIRTGKYTSFTGLELTLEKWFPAWLLAADHPIVRRAGAGLAAAGLPISHGAYNFCTNAAYSIGKAGVPTIGFGPSVEAMAHITDEYVELEALEKACMGFMAIIRSLLGASTFGS